MALPIDGRNLLSFRKINVHVTRCSYKNYFLKDIGHFWLSPVSFNIIFFHQQKKKITFTDSFRKQTNIKNKVHLFKGQIQRLNRYRYSTLGTRG